MKNKAIVRRNRQSSKISRKRPSANRRELAKARKWVRHYFVARIGEPLAREDEPSLSAVRARLEKAIGRLHRALRNPLNPRNAAMLARLNEEAMDRIVEDVFELRAMAEAVKWGLRGEPKAELEAVANHRREVLYGRVMGWA